MMPPAEILTRETREDMKGPVCACLQQLRPRLRQDNGAVAVENSSGAAILHVRMLDRSRPPPPLVVASFCPFCGDAYE